MCLIPIREEVYSHGKKIKQYWKKDQFSLDFIKHQLE